MVPSSVPLLEDTDGEDDPDSPTRRNPLVIGLSILLVVLLVLPPLAVVLSRLGI
jgi:hypothetical protein